jgi:hypothetical protein
MKRVLRGRQRGYTAKVTNKVVQVRIDAESRYGGWDACRKRKDCREVGVAVEKSLGGWVDHSHLPWCHEMQSRIDSHEVRDDHCYAPLQCCPTKPARIAPSITRACRGADAQGSATRTLRVRQPQQCLLIRLKQNGIIAGNTGTCGELATK